MSQNHFWTPFFGAQSSSTIYFSIVFLGVAIRLIKLKASDLETFSTALAVTLSAIWFYELIYHFSFPANYYEFVGLRLNTFILESALSLLVLVGYKHLRVRGNYSFLGTSLLFLVSYSVWLLIGFPQVDGTFVLARYLYLSNPFYLGWTLNRFSKLFLCLAWVSLYR